MSDIYNWLQRCNTRGLQIFLLVVIGILCALLVTQNLWVPKLVQYILDREQSVDVTEIASVEGESSAKEVASRAALLSEAQLQEIVRETVYTTLRNKAPEECLRYSSEQEDDYVLYTVTQLFNETCPGDSTAAPTIPKFKIHATSGQVLIQSLDGIYR